MDVTVGLLVIALAATAQAVTGFGFALVAVPLLAPAVGVQTAVPTAVMVVLLLSSWATLRERSSVEWRVVLVVSAAGLVGMPLGVVALKSWPEDALRLAIASTVLVFAILLTLRLSLPHGPRAQVVTGCLCGAAEAATGMNGPPLVLLFEALGLSPRAFRASLQAVFAAQSAAAVAGLLWSGQIGAATLSLAALAPIPLAVGWLVGNRLFARLDRATFRWVVIATLVLSSAGTIVDVALS